ncbi:hypothetical protein [Microbacterium sp. BF1]|uniref:hypothetical protein n=1 Tax=Microbacterium sp. BF1 TaxID=2821146 RepID=UPI001C4DFD5D|nr:hypothetical protein [Microbacterium sp. BF1]
MTVGSSHVTQTATVDSRWHDEAESLLQLLSESLVALPEEARDAVAPLVEDARGGVAEQNPSRVKRALGKVGEFLGSTASGALGGHLATQIPTVLALLG